MLAQAAVTAAAISVDLENSLSLELELPAEVRLWE